MPSRIHPVRVLATLALLAITAMLGCSKPSPVDGKKDEATEKKEGEKASVNEVILTAEAVKKAGIQVEGIKEHVLMPSFRVPARIAYNDEATAHVGTPVAGRVLQIKVKLGDIVKQHDELLVIESRELGEAQSNFLQKRAAAAIAHDSAEAPKTALDRAKSLEGGTVSTAEVQKRQAEYRAAKGNVRLAEVASTAAEQKLRLMGMDEKAIAELATSGHVTSSYIVRAPISGAVIQREVTLGEPVVPEKETLLILADLSMLWVLADVPEAKLRRVAKGAKVRVRTTMESEHPLEGSVSLISPSINPSTRSLSVRVEIQGGYSSLTPGMFAEAEIFEGSAELRKPVLAVPEAAIQTVDGETVVFVPVEGKENTFAKRTLRQGREVGGMVQVVDGLKAGDRIVTTGSLVLKSELAKALMGDNDDH